MKAHIERDWPRGGYNLYLFHQGQNYKIPFLLIDNRFDADPRDKIQDGAILPPTLFIPDEVYEPLRKAMVGEAIDSDDALRDTRQVRDRLLGMVESEWQSRQLEKP